MYKSATKTLKIQYESIDYMNEKLILQAKGLTVKYHKNVRLDKCDLSIRENEVFGLLGQNGSGKSTLIRAILGLVTPNEGETLFFCQRRDVGLVPQQYAFFSEYTVEENIRLFCNLNQNLKSTNEVIEEFELKKFSKVRANELSGGYKRLLNIAITMTRPLKLLILDEPTANMDVVMRKKIMEIVKRTCKDRTSIIITTHYMDEAEEYCERIAIMENGRIIICGTIEDILEKNGKGYVVDILSQHTDKIRKELENTEFEVSTKEKNKMRIIVPYKKGRKGVADVSKICSKHGVDELSVQEPSLAKAISTGRFHD